MAPVLRIFPALVFPEGDYLMEPYEILAGPLTIWLSPVGTAFPLIDAEPGAEWKLMGTRGTRNMSNDGVTVQLNQTVNDVIPARSEEHTSGLPSLMRNSYDVLCLK